MPSPPASACEIAAHLDMGLIGRVCKSIGLPAYRSVLASFLADASGHQAALLAALERADVAALRQPAHSLKGASASLGLAAVRAITERLEQDAEHLDPGACAEAAALLRARLQAARNLLQRMGLA